MATSLLRRATLPAAVLLVGVRSPSRRPMARPVARWCSPARRRPRDIKRGDFKQVDLAPHGVSPGDYFLAAGTLRENGKVAARGHATCTVIDHSYRGQDCQLVLVFLDGTITAAGGGINRLLPGQAPPPPHAADETAVTGGTGAGAYRGASGTLSMQSHPDDSQTITISL